MTMIRPFQKLLSAALGAILILLSPGPLCVRASAQVFDGSSAGQRGTGINVQAVPAPPGLANPAPATNALLPAAFLPQTAVSFQSLQRGPAAASAGYSAQLASPHAVDFFKTRQPAPASLRDRDIRLLSENASSNRRAARAGLARPDSPRLRPGSARAALETGARAIGIAAADERRLNALDDLFGEASLDIRTSKFAGPARKVPFAKAAGAAGTSAETASAGENASAGPSLLVEKPAPSNAVPAAELLKPGTAPRQSREPAAAESKLPSSGDEPVSPEAKRAVKGFSLARTFSIFVYMFYGVAFASMAMDALGKGSFATIGIISALAAIPLAFVNGALVDKLSPRQILVGGSVVLAAVAMTIAGLSSLHWINFYTLVPLAIVTQFMLLAILVGEGSIVAKILNGNPKHIQRTNALFDLIFAGVGGAGSLAGGWLVAHVLGYVWTFVLYAAVQLAVATLIYPRFIPKGLGVTRPVPSRPKPGFGESFSILRRSPYMLVLLGLLLSANFLIFPLRITLIPVIARDYLHGSPALLGLLNAAVYAGTFVASVFNTFLAQKFDNGRLLLWSALAFPAFGILLAFPHSILALFAGITLMFLIQTVGFNVLRALYMAEAQQEHPEFMGRLMGLNAAIFGAAIFSGTWLLKWVMSAAPYPASLWYQAPFYAAATALYFAALWIIRWSYRRTHPQDPKPPL